MRNKDFSLVFRSLAVGFLTVAVATYAPSTQAKPPGKLSVVYSLDGTTVKNANLWDLVLGPDNAIYGVSSTGGAADAGVIFRFKLDDDFCVLHTFSGGDDGGQPSSVFFDNKGNLFGFTLLGGDNPSYGTAFRLSKSGRLTSIHHFNGEDGGQVSGGVVVKGNDFFATAGVGGSLGKGALLKMSPSGGVSVLYSFGQTDPSAGPYWGLTRGNDGLLYGMTYGWVSDVHGTVFRSTLSGDVSYLHTFEGGEDGSRPLFLPTPAKDGSVYGSTLLGGSNNLGVVFKIDPAGNYSILHTFTGGDDGARPTGLIQAENGRFYGATSEGGANGAGVLFEISGQGAYRVLFAFTGGYDGGYVGTRLLEVSKDTFYGISGIGGRYGLGSIFRFKLQ
jgi:uncharacterized repeat protein (TIGR03803 family)